MTVTVTVDRIEGDTAVLEVGDRVVDWPLEALPRGVAEGMVLTVTFATGGSALESARARLERLKAGSGDDDEIDL